MALYLRPHASQAPAAPLEMVERRFHGQVPRHLRVKRLVP